MLPGEEVARAAAERAAAEVKVAARARVVQLAEGTAGARVAVARAWAEAVAVAVAVTAAAGYEVAAGEGGEGRGEGGVEAGRAGYEAAQRTSRWCGTAGLSRAERPRRLEAPSHALGIHSMPHGRTLLARRCATSHVGCVEHAAAAQVEGDLDLVVCTVQPV